jgi:hypothetical protein
MANLYTKHSAPATGSIAMWNFKEALIAAGWTCRGSGTGTAGAWHATNDLLTSGEAFTRTYGWIVLRSPDGQRELCIQKGSQSLIWNISYSYDAHFTEGSPDAVTAYTAADQKPILGSAVANYQPFFWVDGSFRQKIMVQNAAPYCFWLWGHPLGGGVGYTQFYCDAMKAGTYPAEDVDPYIWAVNYPNQISAYKTTNGISWTGSTSAGPWGYLKKGLPGEGWVGIPGNFFKDTANVNEPGVSGLGVNPHNGLDDVFPVFYIRSTAVVAPVGYKGTSSLFRWISALRNPGDTFTKTTTRDRIVLGAVATDWDGSLPEV